jgi:hypothetical protein
MKFGEVCRVTCEDTIVQFGCLGTAWGYVREDPRRVVLLFGWESVEVSRSPRRSIVLVLIVFLYYDGRTIKNTRRQRHSGFRVYLISKGSPSQV